MDDEPEVVPATDLSQSYAAMLGEENWEVDVADPDSGAAGREPAAADAPPPLTRIVEALLFVGGAPLTAERAAAAIRGLAADPFTAAIDELNQEYRRQGRPYAIQPQDQGYILALRPRFHSIVERLYGTTKEARLSTAAIDVLSLVAYRQPATKPEIDGIRGLESGALLRQLIRRGLITIVHRGESDQRQVAYGTTARFLQLFGLRSLEDLPQTQDLQKL